MQHTACYTTADCSPVVRVDRIGTSLAYTLTFADGSSRNVRTCPDSQSIIHAFLRQSTPTKTQTFICIDHPTEQVTHIRHKVTLTYVLSFMSPFAYCQEQNGDGEHHHTVHFYSNSYWTW